MSAPKRWRERLVAPVDDPYAVLGVWDQAVHGWTLAGPLDRDAVWVHREDIHPVETDLLATDERRRAWRDESAALAVRS